MAEKYSSFLSVGKRGMHYALSIALVNGISFLIIPITTRYFSSSDFGLFSLCRTLVIFLSNIFFLGQSGSIAYFYFVYKGRDWREFVFSSMMVCTVFASIFSAFLFFFGEPLFSFITPDISFYPFIPLVILIAFFSYYPEFIMMIYRAKEKSISYLITSVTQAFLSLTFLVFFVIFLGLGVLGALDSILFSTLAMCILAFFLLKSQWAFKFRPDMIKETLMYGIPITLHLLSSKILIQIDRVFLGYYYELSDVGIYTVGGYISQILKMVSNGLNFAWFPFFMRIASREEKSHKFLGEMATYFILLLWACALPILLFSTDLIGFLTTKDFLSANIVVFPLILTIIFGALNWRIADSLYFKKKTIVISLVTIFMAIVNIALNFLLVPQYKFLGAAWASTISAALACLVLYFPARKAYPVKMEWWRLLKVSLVFVLAFLLSTQIPKDFSSLYQLMAKLILLAIVPFVLVGLRCFSVQELRRVKEIFVKPTGDQDT